MKRKKGYFSISAVAQMLSLHQQTIRLYEREGLISPKRSSGNTRLFSEEDINQLEEIIFLTQKVGVNLTGIEMILKQRVKIEKLQNKINKMFTQFQTDLEEETRLAKKQIESATHRLSDIKHTSKKTNRKTHYLVNKLHEKK